jgi:hypothetical protein
MPVLARKAAPLAPQEEAQFTLWRSPSTIILDHDAEIRPVQKSDQALESGENENETK